MADECGRLRAILMDVSKALMEADGKDPGSLAFAVSPGDAIRELHRRANPKDGKVIALTPEQLALPEVKEAVALIEAELEDWTCGDCETTYPATTRFCNNPACASGSSSDG